MTQQAAGKSPMLIAEFGSRTAWKGMHITFEEGRFILQGHGPVKAEDVMEYDRQGYLVWVNEGARAWVGARSTSGQRGAGLPGGLGEAPRAVARSVSEWSGRLMRKLRRSLGGGQAASDAPVSRRTGLAKRIFVVAIFVLLLLNTLLLLRVLGVIHLP
jgi:hypothetical protein